MHHKENGGFNLHTKMAILVYTQKLANISVCTPTANDGKTTYANKAWLLYSVIYIISRLCPSSINDIKQIISFIHAIHG